jgi:hypothetical protein
MTSIGTAVVRPVLTRTGSGDLVWWIALTGLCSVLLIPLFVVDVPPLLDYPNHLARAFVLASSPGDPILARFYAPHWSITPNLGFDLIAPALIHVLPVHVAGRLLIAASLLLPVWGAVAYNLALGGRWWSLGAGLIAYNNCLLYGLLNFEISLGLALLLAAGWVRWREDRPRRAITLAAVGAPALFVCHLMGLVFFGLLIGSNELIRLHEVRFHAVRRDDFWSALLARGLILLLIFAAPIALYEISDLQQLGGDAEYPPLGQKLLQLLTTFVNYVWALDMTTAGVVLTITGVSLAMRWGRVPGPAAIAIALLLITFLATPFAWKGTYYLDTRFSVMLGFMLFAGCVPVSWPAGFRFAAAAALVLLFVVRMALLTTAWAEHRADLADLRAVLAPVQPGQTVYVAELGLKEELAYWQANPRWRLLSDGVRIDEHLGALVLIERRAYWPFQFDIPSQQPIETREPYRALAGRVGYMPIWGQAATADVCGFDYVLLMEADAVPDLPAERFRLLVRSGFAALYTIVKCKAAS